LSGYGRSIDDEPEIFVSPDMIAGVWANDVRAHRTPHEMTIDFVRLDPVDAQGVLVARVSCSPLTAGELVDKLTPLWRQWVAENLPPEMTDGIS
jgi:hypothetical protein